MIKELKDLLTIIKNRTVIFTILIIFIGSLPAIFDVYLLDANFYNQLLACFTSMSVSFLMSAYVIEAVFSYEGLGSLLIHSITYKDYPVVLALVLFNTAFLLCLNALLELFCKIMDKRALYA